MMKMLLASAALIVAGAVLPASAHETDRYGNPTANSSGYMRDYHARVAYRRQLREHARPHADLNNEHAQAHAEGMNGADHADTHGALAETHDQFHRDHPAVPGN